MRLSPEERYRFDAAGFFVRPAILGAQQVASISHQVASDPASIPGGPAGVLIDHPAVVGAVGELVGASPRIEDVEVICGPELSRRLGGIPLDPPDPDVDFLEYRVVRGRPRCPVVRVAVELTPVRRRDRLVTLLPGSHRAEADLPPELLRRAEEPDEPLFVSYDCPAGSVVVAAGGLLRYRPASASERSRMAIELVYVHPAVAYSRNIIRREVLESLPKGRQAFFRDPWQYDFSTDPPRKNVIDRFLDTT
jgi:hypothetical protein